MSLARRVRAADPLEGRLPAPLAAPDRARGEIVDVEIAGPWRPNPWRWVATGTAVAAAVAVLTVVLARRDDTSTTSVPPADVAAIARLSPALAEHFAIFRRAATPADALPASVVRSLPAPVRRSTDVAGSRLVVRSGADRVWALPGRAEVCLVYAAGDQIGWGCTALSAALAAGHRASTGMHLDAERNLLFALFADGVTSARLERDGAPVRDVPIRGNGAAVALYEADRLTWRSPDGSRHGIRLANGGLYTPGVHHAHRPPGSVYGDEVGENIVGLHTSYARVVQLFGPPARVVVRDGDGVMCVYYRLADGPRGWQFCFRDGGMMSGSGYFRERDFPRFPNSS